MERAFICHSSQDSKFVIEVCRFLKQSLDDIYYYEDYQRKEASNSYIEQIIKSIIDYEIFIAFVGKNITDWLKGEIHQLIQYQLDSSNEIKKKVISVLVDIGRQEMPSEIGFLKNYEIISTGKGIDKDTNAFNIANEIVRRLGLKWKSRDGLPPISNYFQYEKDIIKDYINLKVFGDKLYSGDSEKKDTIHWCFNLLGLREKLGLPEVEFKDLIKKYLELPEIRDELRNDEDFLLLTEGVFNGAERTEKLTYKKADVIKKFNEIHEKIEEIRLDLRDKLINGLPPVWPKVKEMPGRPKPPYYHKNTVNESITGAYRPADARVLSAALTSFHPKDVCIYKDQLTFPEAGPRELLFYPRPDHNLKVAILVSGGIAPGINSVINGITQRHELYANESETKYSVEVYGLQNGFYAFDDYYRNLKRLKSSYTSANANESGSCIGTSRDDRLLEISEDQDQCQFIIEQLLHDGIDILYIIGGDGSMKAAHALWNYSKEMIKERFRNRKISIVGIPKTMDNDILWVWQTFGFLSAVEKAREIIEHLSAEVISNPRICIVQLFGSDSGFVVSHAVVASKSTICDVALIPEVHFTMRQLAEYLTDKIESQRNEARIPMSLIVMAETAIPDDALDYIDDPVVGLTDNEKIAIKVFIETKQLVSINKRNDFLRTAGLKIVSRVLDKLLPHQDNQNISWRLKRVFTNEPRHLLRTTTPSCSDTIMGNRLGTLAVDNALGGYSDFMISQWLTEFVLVPLRLVVLGKKRIPTSGIFWKSVMTKTGQPDLNVGKKKSGGRKKISRP